MNVEAWTNLCIVSRVMSRGSNLRECQNGSYIIDLGGTIFDKLKATWQDHHLTQNLPTNKELSRVSPLAGDAAYGPKWA